MAEWELLGGVTLLPLRALESLHEVVYLDDLGERDDIFLRTSAYS